jgi:hypothetical protein
MGYTLVFDYTLVMSDNGPCVLLYPPYKLDGVQLPHFTLILPFNFSRSDVIQYMRTLPYKVTTTIAHSPVLNSLLQDSIDKGFKTLEDIEIEQLVTEEDGSEFLDEFGMKVYACSVLVNGPGELIDTRYD